MSDPAQGDVFAKVIDDLYAGALDATAWRRAIVSSADMVRASGALLMVFDVSTGAVLRGEDFRVDPSVLRDYRRYWSYEDDRLPAALSIPTGVPVTEQTLELPGKWNKTAIVNEFLVPSDVPHFMPAWLHKSTTKAVTLSFQGTRKRGPFEPQDIETYRRLLPHISRALEIRDRLERAQFKTSTFARHFETLKLGVAILDAGGRLVEANSVVQELLRLNCGVRRLTDGTLWLREPAGTQLKHWTLTGLPPSNSTDGLLHVPRVHALPLSVMVVPLSAETTCWIGADLRWLLVFFDPDRRVEIGAEVIARDLGISEREAEIATLLFAGYNLRESAQRLGVSEHTVRAQLKSIFRKTGIRSQVDLIRRITLGPASWASAGRNP